MVGTDELSTLLVTSPAGRVLIDGGLRAGRALPSDPQHTEALPFSAVPQSQVFADDDTVRVGPLALVAHLTPEHPLGGTTWSWRACEGTDASARCHDVVYADSQTPISDDTFRYGGCRWLGAGGFAGG